MLIACRWNDFRLFENPNSVRRALIINQRIDKLFEHNKQVK